jgi:hypothetical protein
MTYLELASHRLVYIAIAIGICYVLGFTVFCLQKAWKRAVAIGFTRKRLFGIVKTAALFAVVPSIAILVGFFSLASWLGIPLAWWRLSVVGSVTYEIMAADMAMKTSGIVALAEAGAKDFILVMFVMTIGIMGGMVVNPIGAKSVHMGTVKLKQRDKYWGSLANSTYMLTIIIVFAVPVLLGGPVQLFTLLTGMLVTGLLFFVIKKTRALWLNDFLLVISMVVAMVSSVLWAALFK